MKSILLLLTFIFFSNNLFSKNIDKIIERNKDFYDKFELCINKEIENINIKSLLQEQKLRNYKNNYMDFELYINNNGLRERILNNKIIKLRGSNTYCNNEEVKYSFEIKIKKESISNKPETIFFNNLNIEKIKNNNIISSEKVDIIYKPKATTIVINQLKDFNINYDVLSNQDVNVENSFCIYTEGVVDLNLVLTDNTGGNWNLINIDQSNISIPYEINFRKTNTSFQPVFNNIPIQNIVGNSNSNCSSGDLFYLNLYINKNDIKGKKSGIYKPNNTDGVIYIRVSVQNII